MLGGFAVADRIPEVPGIQFDAQTPAPRLYRHHRHSADAHERVQHGVALVGVAVDEPLHDVELERAQVVLLPLPLLHHVERPHPRDVGPHLVVPGRRLQQHEPGRQPGLVLKVLAQPDMLPVVVDGAQPVIPELAEHLGG